MPIISDSSANIFEYPSPISIHRLGANIALGDMHGNPMLLLYFLIREGIADINPAHYQQLVSAYLAVSDATLKYLILRQSFDEQYPGDKSKLPEENRQTINSAINPLKEDIVFLSNQFITQVQMIKFKKDVPAITLIGDTLADRGSNDWLTLKIFEHLAKNNICFELILSNHDLWFLEYYQDSKVNAVALTDPPLQPLQFQGKSLDILDKTINLPGGPTRDQLRLITETVYLPRLKVIGYNLSADEQSIALYTHAPIRFDFIAYLAETFEIHYKDSTASELAKTCDNINAAFYKKYVLDNAKFSAIGKALQKDKKNQNNFTTPEDCLVHFTWERPIVHPKIFSGNRNYHIYFVHGHDEHSTYQGSFNLDSHLGKGMQFIGEYRCFHTQGHLS